MGMAWGATPAQLRECTAAEFAAMVDLLAERHKRTRRG